MDKNICILSTRKLKSNQKQFLLNANFSVIEADFINIELLPFQIENHPTLLLFTSQNAVLSVLKNNKAEQLKSIPAICVGSKTKELLLDNGFEVLATTEYAKELAPIVQSDFSDKHIAFFAGNFRRDILPNAMKEANITFDEYHVYDNKETSIKINSQIDGLLFYSPSGVNSYLKNNTITHEMCFCIGTTTADALKGITENIIIANHQTIDNVIVQCINYYKK